ncbi:IclR family transcriptional regulator [Natrinema salifodinae]|uniref:Transcriptional regulator, IclR family n=1 Tax=Natrinema salifodinae TaxID=1202768 RepID=A0A1I0LXY9_9EURY|nr:IclR family transcriptional regulator [Natrinema salifodinae]SEV80451.1 transcriptional regulator, IclR family [Natrinema salifodinae]
MTTSDTGPETPVKTAQTTFRIVEALKTLDGATVTAIAERLDLPKSSAYNYLKTLEHEGYVVSDGGEYELGLRFLDLGAYARQKKKLYTVAKPELRSVAEETGELANLLVEENGHGVFIVRERGPDAVNIDSYTGQCVHLHTTALGKTILAHLPSDRRDEIIDRYGLPAKTDRTITDRETLLNELDEIRQNEVAYDREERIKGLHCVAVPVFEDDRISGAISVSGPNSRMDDERIRETILPQLRHAANIVELNQTYS